MTTPPRNIQRHDGEVSRQAREQLLGQRGAVLWFTGLSGSGKSTVARAVEARLHAEGRLVYVLDGDNIRHGLCADLGFAPADRTENIRRIGHVAALLVDAGAIVLTAFISPYRSDREQVRTVLGEDFLEIHVDASVEVCEKRDPKGLYKKARAGNLKNFTGIDSPYEAPEAAEVVLNTSEMSAEDAAERVVQALLSR